MYLHTESEICIFISSEVVYTWVPKFMAVYNVKCDLVLNNI